VEVGSDTPSIRQAIDTLIEFERAIESLHNKLATARDRADECMLCYRLGTCYLSLGQFDRAIEYVSISRDISMETGDIDAEREANATLSLTQKLLVCCLVCSSLCVRYVPSG